MDLLLVALLLLCGDVNANHSEMTFEQMLQASLESQYAVELTEDVNIDNEAEWVKVDPQADKMPPIRGIFVTAHSVGHPRFEGLLQLVEDTALNAMVIDIKEDAGYMTYKTENLAITEIGTYQNIIRDMEQLMTTLDEKDIYPIARIVVFKDTILANKRPDLSFLNSNGSVWHNNKSTPEAYVNPYKQEVWEYNLEIAKEAAAMGFKEIQFDYVRFPEGFETRADQLQYETDERSRTEVINEFVKYAREQLNPLGVRVSVDIFGYAASVPAAEGIGQDFNGISKYVDVISPMVYPSHYSTGWFGSAVPDAEPYITIDGAMVDTHEKLEEIGEFKPIIRPWIQDFTAPWIRGYIPYGKEEVEAQIKALYDNEIYEFLLWNSRNVYSQDVDYLVE